MSFVRWQPEVHGFSIVQHCSCQWVVVVLVVTVHGRFVFRSRGCRGCGLYRWRPMLPSLYSTMGLPGRCQGEGVIARPRVAATLVCSASADVVMRRVCMGRC